jgi:hypothetical protein
MVCVLENNVASDFSNLGSYGHQCAFAFFHKNETIETNAAHCRKMWQKRTKASAGSQVFMVDEDTPYYHDNESAVSESLNEKWVVSEN